MNELEKAARESSTRAGYNPDSAADAVGQTVYETAFIAGAKWAYMNKSKPKHMCLRDKSKVCNQCHECDVDVLNPSY